LSSNITTYFCKECGYETPKWAGKCPVCDAWDSFKESTSVTGKKKSGGKLNVPLLHQLASEPIKTIEPQSNERLLTGNKEFDRVIGGGIINGMVCLIGGEPGIGKSTLMLQIADEIAQKGWKVLYISGEESRDQIKQRSDRVKTKSDSLFLFCSNSVEHIIDVISKDEPDLVVVDSIQSIGIDEQSGSPGSVSQVRESTILLTQLAKRQNIPMFIIGHVTKEGLVAGPKIIEHLVDTVLYFEGDNYNQLKILKTTKNRFGSTNEIGVFEMGADGLTEVLNPSRLFIRDEDLSAGSAIGCVIEGTRSFLIEVQALVTPAVYGNAQRIALGIDHKKLSLMLAIIEKKLSLKIRENDVFVNLVGGLKVSDPALDLAFIAAIISSYENQPLPPKTIFLGEIGLNGEIRPVSNIDKRIKEATKLGYERIVVPEKSKVTVAKNKIKRIDYLNKIYPILFS